MLPPLYARPAADRVEERRIRRLANARHAPASWLHRFNEHGIDGLGDLPRSGRPRRLGELDRGQVIALARSDPPGRLVRQPDGTLEAADAKAPAQWTLDALAQAAQAQGIQVGRSQVRRILQADGVRWRTVRSWSTSTDADFAPKDPHALRAPRR